MEIKKRLVALFLALTTTISMVGCNTNDKDNDSEKDNTSIEILYYDNSDLDLYQVITINYDGRIQTILGKLSATPYNPTITYKIIADIKVIYELNRETNKMVSSYDILEIESLTNYLSEEEVKDLKQYNDDEIICLYYDKVVNKNDVKKLVKNN